LRKCKREKEAKMESKHIWLDSLFREDLLDAEERAEVEKEQAEQRRMEVAHCPAELSILTAAWEGWKPAWDTEGHASNCGRCHVAARASFRNYGPGRWIWREEETDGRSRPLWWRMAVEDHRAASPSVIGRMASLWKQAGLRLTPAWEVGRSKEDGLAVHPLQRVSEDDALLFARFRKVGDEYELMVKDSNDEVDREGKVVQVVVMGDKGQLVRNIRIETTGLWRSRVVKITEQEKAKLGAESSLELLPPVVLSEEEAGRPRSEEEEEE
jgi:hypothetical protein